MVSITARFRRKEDSETHNETVCMGETGEEMALNGPQEKLSSLNET